MNKDELIEKICKRIIVVFGVLAIFNFILLINKKSYALFTKTIVSDKVVVHIETGDSLPVKTAVSVIKQTMGVDGGIIGVTNNSEKTTTASNDIREYRYSGTNVNNYVYFNCDEGTTNETAKDNCEIWRIIGIFKGEDGEEHLKLVRNDILSADTLPVTYVLDGKTYNIKFSSTYEYNKNDALAYWHNDTGYNYKNDWAIAGLKNWLNSDIDAPIFGTKHKGYHSYLKGNTLDMIVDTKYYLGTVNYYDIVDDGEQVHYGITDTPKEAYANERDVEGCVDNTGKSPSESGCRVPSGNAATWTGKIGLMYPSDFGYSTDSEYWNTKLQNDIFTSEASLTSWFSSLENSNHSFEEWLITPISPEQYSVTVLKAGSKYVLTRETTDYFGAAVRPTLYLNSQVKINSGNGTSETPYFLEN